MRRYAKKQGLPAPDSTLSADSKDKPGQKKTCIDVCAEFGGVQDCQTRCVRSEADKKHACREACQVRQLPLAVAGVDPQTSL